MAFLENPLSRILSRTDAEHLLASFASLLSGTNAAIFDINGRQIAQQGHAPPVEGWAVQVGTALQQSPADVLSDQPVCLEGALYYPLLLERQNLGWLVVDAPVPVGTALQSMLALLLKERVEKRRLARETLDRYREVNLLYHLAERFGTSLDVGEILQIALSEAQRVIRAGCGMVWLTSSDVQPAYFGAEAETGALENYLRALLQKNPDVTTPNTVTEFGADIIAAPQGESTLAFIMYTPLRVHGDLLGLLALGKFRGQPEFTAGEEKLLTALAEQAAGAVEKAVLHQKDLQHQRIAQELEIGRRIQRSLLPKSMPALPAWEFAASYQAASQVGGDFYDIFPLPAETECWDVAHYGLTIADVSGKGIPAALMMAFSQGILHNAAFDRPRPGDVLYQTNRSILQSSNSGLLLTAFYAVLNPCTGVLTYANGGHEPPILYRAAAAESHELVCGASLLLGAHRERSFAEFEIQMEPGDLLLLYTDGVTEARDPAGAFFAEERLSAVVSQYARFGCSQLLKALNEALSQFADSAPQSDDITLFALRRLS